MQIFVDLDGVLADFDAHYQAVFGVQASKLSDNVDWSAVRAVTGFYEAMPPMADMAVLWRAVEHYHPIILTGVPSSVPEAPENKRAWVRKHLGPQVEVRCCRSRDKCLHAASGDVLIDDWEKYRHLWVARGGRWVTHHNAADTIRILETSIFNS